MKNREKSSTINGRLSSAHTHFFDTSVFLATTPPPPPVLSTPLIFIAKQQSCYCITIIRLSIAIYKYNMVFFGAILTDGESTEISVPPGHCLKILQANVDVRDFPGKHAMLMVQTPLDDAEIILACFSKTGALGASLQHDFNADDNPLVFRAEGGIVHLSGNWIIDDEGSDGSMDDSDEDEEEEEEEDIEEEGCCPSAGHKDCCAEAPVAAVVAPAAAVAADGEKKTTRNKRGRNGQKIDETALPAPVIVVAAGMPKDTSSERKKWNVKPQNDEGMLVDEPKYITKSGGVLIKDMVIGKGKEPKLGAAVQIVYEGMFPDGKIFDANLKRKKPFVFRKGTGDVVRGMDLGMEGMRVGGSREMTIPSELG
jgi:FKBP-type peptidyl-prolyl cis-trans isomerase